MRRPEELESTVSKRTIKHYLDVFSSRLGNKFRAGSKKGSGRELHTANPQTKNLEFQGLDSVRLPYL